MGAVHAGIPKEMAPAIAKALGVTHFIEGGTLHGETAAWAAQTFTHVSSIERSPSLFALAGPLAGISRTWTFLSEIRGPSFL